MLAPFLAGAAARLPARTQPRLIDGIVWQISQSTLQPRGSWHRLGARHLLVQWTAVDGLSFVPDSGLPSPPEPPDWRRIAAEPWANAITLGLAGMHDEAAARSSVPALVAQGRALALAAAPLPLRVDSWYFPVEVDPTWTHPIGWPDALRELPRPLWISAYDSANQGPEALADWIVRWVPPDVGIFFQDGVGVHAREPQVARTYLQTLTRRIGAPRVRVIAEAFRPAAGGGFRSATASEFLPQIEAYQGWPIHAFDGPHYMTDRLVDDLLKLGLGQ